MSRMLRGLLAPAGPARLAGNRIVLGLYTFRYLARRRTMFAKVHRTDPSLFAPVGPVRVLRGPLPPGVADAILLAELGTSILFTLGVAHRIVGPAHAALLLWTTSYRNSWSMIFHSDNTLVLHTTIVACAPAADAWSLARHKPLPAPHWRYALPTRVMSATTAITYWLSGVAKVRGPLGWGWAGGDAMRSQVAADGLRKEVLGSSAAKLGTRLYRHRWFWRMLAAPSLALELLAPVTLIHPVMGRLWAASAFAMHWGIKAVMNITFRYQLSGAAYASFIPWDRLRRR